MNSRDRSDASIIRRCEERLTTLRSQNLLRLPRTVDLLPSGRCKIGDREVVNFGGNDYLGLAQQLGTSANVREVLSGQFGATASAVVAGRSQHHAELERALSDFEQTQASLLFPSGFAANLGVLAGLVEPGDAVFCDRDNHASIIDAAKNSDGKLQVYRRTDLENLRSTLSRRRASFQNLFIVTDGVFSMDGEIAPLTKLCDIADEFEGAVIVDEAHGTGVLGEKGGGACDHCGVEDRVFLRIGTMSKAMGGLGGFAVSRESVIELLRNVARTQFFSTALPPVICEAMMESLRIIRDEPQRRERLSQLTQCVRQTAQDQGCSLIGDGIAPIVPIGTASEDSALKISERLMNAGFFIPAIRPPTVAPGTSRLRMSLNVLHSEEVAQAAIQAIIGS